MRSDERPLIPFIKPNFPSGSSIASDFEEITDANWYTNFGPKEQQFCSAIEGYLGQDLCVTTMGNGTLALLAAVQLTFGHGSGTEYLLMPSFTFSATAQCAIWGGYRPWFIDIHSDTLQASADAARHVVEKNRDRIAGIVLPNAFGTGNPRIAEWEELAAEWDLKIVIDSAAGFGSRYPQGQLLGGRGHCEIFSFHATKPFAIGEGGAVVSRDAEFIQRAQEFQNFGFDATRESTQLGINAKLSEISAAIGLRQLKDFDERLTSRRTTFERYRSELSALGCGFQANAEASSLCFATICLDSADAREAVSRGLAENRVQAREYYNPPLHRHALFNGDNAQRADLSNTESVCSRVVSLPIHDFMNADDIDRVVYAVTDALSTL